MMLDVVPSNLTGKMLIAMPGMADNRFSGSVVFLCAHSEDGAVGLIINTPVTEITFREMIEQLGIDAPRPPELSVHFGGPIEPGRGFVPHSCDYAVRDATLQVNDCFAMTSTLDVLVDIAERTGPENALLTLGYSSWAAGQLEAEILHNGWLTCDAATALVFDDPDERKWELALASIGVHPMALSSEAGHA
jgi:putative transcriptional regulator